MPGLRPDAPGRAVLFILLAAILLPTVDVLAKYLSRDFAALQISWARFFGHLGFMLLVFAPRRGVRLLRTTRPGLQMVRSTLLCVSTLAYFTAIRTIAVPTATAISFTGPFIVILLAPLLLGERVGFRRWLAVAFGFIGALVILRPGFDLDDWATEGAMGLVLVSATCSALYQVLTRKLAAYDPAETSITYVALVGAVLMSLPLPFVWKTPQTAFELLFFLGLGVLGGLGHYCILRAYERAPAPFVAPFNYTQLVSATCLSYLVFAQIPDLATGLGAFIIVASGIYAFRGERNAIRWRRWRAAFGRLRNPAAMRPPPSPRSLP